jgi:ribosomal protein S18 acetylase RimI-like enzyme
MIVTPRALSATIAVDKEAVLPRIPVATRAAVVSDVPVLLDLWRELSEVGARAERAVDPVASTEGDHDVAARFADAIGRDDCRVVLACVDGKAAGMAVFHAMRPDPLSDSRVLQMNHVVVAKSFRRRGVGHALVAAAVEFADELRVDHVSVGVYPSLREASRFYARLGFAQVSLRRIAPVGVLRRRLASEAPGRRVEDLVRRRTRLRRPVPAQRVIRSTETLD